MDERRLWREIQKVYGKDVILVHKRTTPYYITTSANAPGDTKAILQDLVNRWH
jgi:hypothetical protein